jgi:DNA-binding beta-propeller fold protein YncE
LTTALAGEKSTVLPVAMVPIDGADQWDYVSYDQGSRRVFLAHDREVTVLDGVSGSLVGRIADLVQAHGVAFVPSLGRGFATNNDGVTAFDLKDLRTLGNIATDAGADGVLFDGASGWLIVMNAKGQSVSFVDPASGLVEKAVGVGGKPEAAASGGDGRIFVNVEPTGEIVRLDARTKAETARWRIDGCEKPHGLAYDALTQRLFSGCANGRLAVVDSDSGALATLLPIGLGNDTVLFDSRRRLVLSSNGDGTLSMISVGRHGELTRLPDVVTRPGAKTMAFDSESGRIFLAAGDVGNLPAAERAKAPIAPGSLSLLIYRLNETPAGTPVPPK